MLVENSIADCLVAGRQKPMGDVKFLMVHRFGWPYRQEWIDRGFTADAKGCAEFYRTVPEARKATGGKMPYGFTVGHAGIVEQCAPLGIVTPHAQRFSVEAIGVGVFGDFQHQPPTDAQRIGLEDLCAMLLDHWPHLELVGHSDIEGAASSGKVCPGHLLDIRAIRAEVLSICQDWSGQRLMDAGVVF